MVDAYDNEKSYSYHIRVIWSSSPNNRHHRSFYQSFVRPTLILLALILAASFDLQVDLKEKLMLQSSGLSKLLDTYSDAITVVVILYLLATKETWSEMSEPLKKSYLGSVAFGAVATYFHATVDESEPHPLYSCFFCTAGAFILLWHARGVRREDGIA